VNPSTSCRPAACTWSGTAARCAQSGSRSASRARVAGLVQPIARERRPLILSRHNLPSRRCINSRHLSRASLRPSLHGCEILLDAALAAPVRSHGRATWARARAINRSAPYRTAAARSGRRGPSAAPAAPVRSARPRAARGAASVESYGGQVLGLTPRVGRPYDPIRPHGAIG
jgi:hypothetical protein